MAKKIFTKHNWLRFLVGIWIGTIGLSFITPLSLGMINQDIPKSNIPLSARAITLNPVLDVIDKEFTDYLADAFLQWGAFPSTGSSLQETMYALETLNALNPLDPYEHPSEIEDIVTARFIEREGGYKELGVDNASIKSTYHALKCLDLVDRTITPAINESIIDFLNGTCVNQTYFVDKLNSQTTSPTTMYQAFWIMDWLNIPWSSFISNPNKTFVYLLESYFITDPMDPEFGFFESGVQKIEDTRYIFWVFDQLGKLEQERAFFTNYNATLDSGTINSGEDSSMYKAGEGQALQLTSTAGGKLEVVFEVSLENVYNNSYDNFLFNITLNASTNLDTNGTVLLFNSNSNQWEQLVSDSYLQAIQGPTYHNFLVNTGTLWLSNYSVVGTEYDQAIRVKILLEDSGQFTAYIDQFLSECTAFDYWNVTQTLGNEYSNGHWDAAKLTENTFAINLLDHVDSAMDFMTPQRWLDMKAFIYTFQQDGEYFITQAFDLFSTMKANFHAIYLLDYMGEADLSLRTSIEDYVWSWAFKDGGFGSYYQTSLRETFHILDILNQTDSIPDTLNDSIIDYLTLCHASPIYFTDFEDLSSTEEDSFYALKIAEILQDETHLSMLPSIASDLISRQTPQGSFADIEDLKDTYHACWIIDQENLTNQLPYIDNLRAYVKDLQQYHGGFLMDPFALLATVEASVYAIEIGQMLDFLDLIQIIEVNNVPGVVDFIKNHQNNEVGGIFEENTEFFTEDTYEATNRITALACQGLSTLFQLKSLNATGLENFVFDQMNEINDLTSLESNLQVYDRIQGRYHVFKAYIEIARSHLKLSVIVDDDDTFPGEYIPINITVKDPTGARYIEGCDIYVYQGETAVKFDDLQNGSYSCVMYPYETPAYYNIRISCEHPEFLGFIVNYRLAINHPLDLGRLAKISRQVTWFSNQHQLKIPLFVENTGEFASGCNVSLLRNGIPAYRLTENNESGFYGITMDCTPWLLTANDYTVKITGELIRTETIHVQMFVVPLYFLIVLAILTALVFVTMYGFVRSVRIRHFEELYLMEEPLSPKQAALAKERIAKKKAKAMEAETKARAKAARAREKAMRALENGRENARIAALKAEWAAEESVQKAEIIADKRRRKELKAQERAERARGIKSGLPTRLTSKSTALHAQREQALAEKRQKEELRKTELIKRKQALKTIKIKAKESQKTAELERKVQEKIAAKERRNAEKIARQQRINEIKAAKIKKGIQKAGSKGDKLQAKLDRKREKEVLKEKGIEAVETQKRTRDEILSTLDDLELAEDEKLGAAAVLGVPDMKHAKTLTKKERKDQAKRLEYIKARKREEKQKKKLRKVQAKLARKDIAANLARQKAEKETLETALLEQKAEREKLAANVAIELAKIKSMELTLTQEKTEVERMAASANLDQEEREKLLSQIDWQRSEKMKIANMLRDEKQEKKALLEAMEHEQAQREKLAQEMAKDLLKKEKEKRKQKELLKKSKVARARQKAMEKQEKEVEKVRSEKEKDEIAAARAKIQESRQKREEEEIIYEQEEREKQERLKAQRIRMERQQAEAEATHEKLEKEQEKTMKQFDKSIEKRKKVSDKAEEEAVKLEAKAAKARKKFDKRSQKLVKAQENVEEKRTEMEKPTPQPEKIKKEKKKNTDEKSDKKDPEQVKSKQKEPKAKKQKEPEPKKQKDKSKEDKKKHRGEKK